MDPWRRSFSIRMDLLEREVQQNTATTNAVRKDTSELIDILHSWKGAMKVLNFLGAMAKPVAAILALVAAAAAFWPKK
jgi:hypothetical protein